MSRPPSSTPSTSSEAASITISPITTTTTTEPLSTVQPQAAAAATTTTTTATTSFRQFYAPLIPSPSITAFILGALTISGYIAMMILGKRFGRHLEVGAEWMKQQGVW